jgi:transcriptional regulator with XRE-family HTH domain
VQIDVRLQQRFGERVRKLRIAKGYSQEAFALQCELDRTYVSGIERGVRNPTLQVLLILARGLGTTISNMTRGVEE